MKKMHTTYKPVLETFSHWTAGLPKPVHPLYIYVHVNVKGRPIWLSKADFFDYSLIIAIRIVATPWIKRTQTSFKH